MNPKFFHFGYRRISANNSSTHLVQFIEHGINCSAVARYAIDSLILKSLLFHNPRTDLHNQRHQLNTTDLELPFYGPLNVKAGNF